MKDKKKQIEKMTEDNYICKCCGQETPEYYEYNGYTLCEECYHDLVSEDPYYLEAAHYDREFLNSLDD